MTLLIDGHNLIGANVFVDIHLSDEDDEAKLVARLKVWKSRYKGKITVIFDRGTPGGIDVKMGGAGVEVVFAANPAQADDLIRRRLQKFGKEVTLVSNDEALLRAAALYGAAVWRGNEFVARLTLKMPDAQEAGMESDVRLSKGEVEEWLELFSKARKRSKPGSSSATPLRSTPRPPAKRPPARPSSPPANGTGQKPRPAKPPKPRNSSGGRGR